MRIRCVPRGRRSLLELLRDKGVEVAGDCGGTGRCGKCRVLLVNQGAEVLACTYVPSAPVVVEVRGKRGGFTRGKSGRSVEKGRVLVADIGTTTLRLSAVDVVRGRRVKTESLLNPQVRFGADVLSRIAQERRARRAGLCRVISDFLAQHGIDRRHPVTVVGNTVMMHFVFGKSAVRLGAYPYVSALPLRRTFARRSDGVLFRTLPLVGGFIGSDCTAGMVAAGMHQTERLTLLVDAGTNGEVVLGNRRRILACSTAAGPAFEGATLECGTLAVPGAITACRLTRAGWRLKTVSGRRPVGICGSGVVDAVAEGLRQGLIEPGGKLRDHGTLLIYPGEPKPVYLTQADIREVQLAKAAIAAGIKLLFQEWRRLEGKSPVLSRVVITGRFGGRLNTRSAIQLGLLPALPEDKITQHPDLPLAGAIRCVLKPELIRAAERLAAVVEEVRLAEHPDFAEVFVDSMGFGRWRF